MLDTITLTLHPPDFEVLEMDKFSPSASGLFFPPYYTMGGRGYMDCRQNPTKTELERGVYKPRLTLTKRKGRYGYVVTLRVEFSAPKLLFGNNFDELADADFARILDILHSKLAQMGIRVTKEKLRTSAVTAIHYSKNIPLGNFNTCSMVLSELAKLDLTKRLDCNKTDYRNEGHAIRCHANSFGVVFYDKIRDMQQAKISEKRAMESDYAIQRNLFEAKPLPQNSEVLRMEVRLGNRTKLKSLIGKDHSLTFETLFREAMAKQVLLHFWQKMTAGIPLVALSGFAPEELYGALLAESGKKTKPSKILQQLGLLALINATGIRGAGSLITQHSDPRTWQRIRKEAGNLDALAKLRYAATREVQHCLDAFQPLRIRDYKM